MHANYLKQMQWLLFGLIMVPPQKANQNKIREYRVFVFYFIPPIHGPDAAVVSPSTIMTVIDESAITDAMLGD